MAKYVDSLRKTLSRKPGKDIHVEQCERQLVETPETSSTLLWSVIASTDTPSSLAVSDDRLRVLFGVAINGLSSKCLGIVVGDLPAKRNDENPHLNRRCGRPFRFSIEMLLVMMWDREVGMSVF